MLPLEDMCVGVEFNVAAIVTDRKGAVAMLLPRQQQSFPSGAAVQSKGSHDCESAGADSIV